MSGISFSRVERLPPGNQRYGEGGKRMRGILKNSSADQPLITVITAVYNGEDHLEETIKRVVSQTYPHLEFIIVDGGSKDRSLEIIRKYDDQIDYWVSEKDGGIGDAFNRGVLLSRGTYINFQGDGDGFCEPEALEKMIQGLKGLSPPLIATRIERVDINGKHLYFSKKMRPTRFQFLFRMVYPHQGLFTHISLFEKFGLFDLKKKYSMDYEHLLRYYPLLSQAFIWNNVTAQWRADGLGNGKTRDILREYDLIKRKHRLTSAFLLFLIDRWSVFKFRLKNTFKPESS